MLLNVICKRIKLIVHTARGLGGRSKRIKQDRFVVVSRQCSETLVVNHNIVMIIVKTTLTLRIVNAALEFEASSRSLLFGRSYPHGDRSK